MLTGRDVRILRWILISLCISGGIAVMTYATQAAYAEMYGSLISKNGTSFAISPDDRRKMLSVHTTAVIDARSAKKPKLSGKKITYIAVAGIIFLVFCWTLGQNAKTRILEWRRSRRPRSPAPSPTLINLEDIVNKIKNQSWPRRRSIYAEDQQPDPCLPEGEQQIGEGGREIPRAFMIREVALPTIRPASDSIKSAPAVMHTREIPSTDDISNPAELISEATENPTPPISEAMSTLTLATSGGMGNSSQPDFGDPR